MSTASGRRGAAKHTGQSIGSASHGDRCKPCLFANTPIGCQKGEECQFCHMPHNRTQATRPCKAKRDRYKKLVARIGAQGQALPVGCTSGASGSTLNRGLSDRGRCTSGAIGSTIDRDLSDRGNAALPRLNVLGSLRDWKNILQESDFHDYGQKETEHLPPARVSAAPFAERSQLKASALTSARQSRSDSGDSQSRQGPRTEAAICLVDDVAFIHARTALPGGLSSDTVLPEDKDAEGELFLHRTPWVL